MMRENRFLTHPIPEKAISDVMSDLGQGKDMSETAVQECAKAIEDLAQATKEFNEATEQITSQWKWHDWLVWYLFYYWR